MKLHKKYKLLIAVLLVLLITVLITILTRQKYWHNIIWDNQVLETSDADYLDVWDLRFLFDDDTKNVEKLADNLLYTAHKFNGNCPDGFKEIISDDLYQRLDPSALLSDEQKKNTHYESYSIREIDVLSHKDKAIVFWGWDYYAYNQNGDNIYGTCFDGYPNRMYLEKINNNWIVTGINMPI